LFYLSKGGGEGGLTIIDERTDNKRKRGENSYC